jgi:hypothetical protein
MLFQKWANAVWVSIVSASCRSFDSASVIKVVLSLLNTNLLSLVVNNISISAGSHT